MRYRSFDHLRSLMTAQKVLNVVEVSQCRSLFGIVLIAKAEGILPGVCSHGKQSCLK